MDDQNDNSTSGPDIESSLEQFIGSGAEQQQKTVLELKAANNSLDLVKSAIASLVILAWIVYATVHKQPGILILALIFFEMVIGLIAFLSWTRRKAERQAINQVASGQPSAPASPPPATQIAVAAGEKLLLSVAGINRNDLSVAKFNVLTGSETARDIENVLLLTTQALYFIYVPVGTNAKTGDYQMNTREMEYILNQKEIRTKLDQLLTTQPLGQIVNSNPTNYTLPMSSIKAVMIKQFTSTLKIQMTDNKEFHYAIRDKAEFTALCQSLSQVLQGRVTIK